MPIPGFPTGRRFKYDQTLFFQSPWLSLVFVVSKKENWPSCQTWQIDVESWFKWYKKPAFSKTIFSNEPFRTETCPYLLPSQLTHALDFWFATIEKFSVPPHISCFANNVRWGTLNLNSCLAKLKPSFVLSGQESVQVDSFWAKYIAEYWDPGEKVWPRRSVVSLKLTFTVRFLGSFKIGLFWQSWDASFILRHGMTS